jgi:cytochrome c peroxidase
MGETLQGVIKKLKSSSFYPLLFKKAFKESTITGESILKALAQFQLTLVSANSKYDRVIQGQEEFSDQEKNGYSLFQENCNSCHQEPLFSNYLYEANGLPIDTTLNDYGKGMITKQKGDSMLFKIPSLRNISYSFPYMHDGRFDKLSQVLKHYSNKETQDYFVKELNRKSIQLNSMERVDLIAFLLTLNDKSFVFNPNHQYPKNILQHSKE